MGLIICEKHGESGIATNIQNEVCEKIYENKPLKNEDLKVIKVNLYDNEDFIMDDNFIVTADLKEGLKLQDVYHIKNDLEYELLIKPFESKMGVVCGQCLNEYKHKKDIESTLITHRKHATNYDN